LRRGGLSRGGLCRQGEFTPGIVDEESLDARRGADQSNGITFTEKAGDSGELVAVEQRGADGDRCDAGTWDEEAASSHDSVGLRLRSS